MLSFKNFVEEIDPVKFAQRASRIIGTGKTIPLKNNQANL